MEMKVERQQIIDYCQKIAEKKLTPGTSGNISILNKEKELIAISPSGIDYFSLKPQDIVLLNLNGDVIDGRRKPSSEKEMHIELYRNRKDINTVIHTHSIFSTIFACLRKPIPPVHYIIGIAGKEIPCCDYATFGTRELAKKAVTSLKNNNSVLLANHGLLVVGNGIENTFNILENVEYTAEIYYRTLSIGDPIILSQKEMQLILEKFKSYGQK